MTRSEMGHVTPNHPEGPIDSAGPPVGTPAAPCRRQTPEERELESKLHELHSLESALAQRELDLTTLQAELAAFQWRYLKRVGVKYAELDDIEALLAEALSRKDPKSKTAKQEASAARERAEESRRATDMADERRPQAAFKPSEELKKLYRQVAKAVHPDLAVEEKERARRQKLMAEANQAYQEGNTERLEAILREWRESPESVKGEGPGAELVRTIRKIAQVRERIRSIEEEVRELQASDLFLLKTKVEEAETEGTDLLAEMALQVSARIDEARRAYERAAGESP